MKHGLLYAFVLSALGLFGLATSLAGAATATGSYYATPSWDQQLPASTRFIVLSNWIDAAHSSGGAAVLDRETGLVWETAPSNVPTTWIGALLACRDSLTGGRAGWRLPTEEELATLLDPTQSSPPLPAGHPFQSIAASDVFWTASSFELTPSTDAWTIQLILFADIARTFDTKSTAFHRFWCVRGGSGAQNPF